MITLRQSNSFTANLGDPVTQVCVTNIPTFNVVVHFHADSVKRKKQTCKQCYGRFCARQNNIMVYPCFTFFVLEVFIRWANLRCSGMWVYWPNSVITALFRYFAEEPRVRVFTATDYMLFDSNDLLYFEVLQPKNISYIYKFRPAKDFGGKFVSSTCNKHAINRNLYSSSGKNLSLGTLLDAIIKLIYNLFSMFCINYTVLPPATAV